MKNNYSADDEIITTIIVFIIVIVSTVAGYEFGINHAITDSEIYAVEVYNPNDPKESEWQHPDKHVKYDMFVVIDLDGQTYEHGCDVY